MKTITINGQPYTPLSQLPAPPTGERWIGPIPSMWRDADDSDDIWPFAGGEGPSLALYRPTLRDGQPAPHNPDSKASLACVETAEGCAWYVSAPADRDTLRGHWIGYYAGLYLSADRGALLALGLRPGEVDAAFSSPPPPPST